MKMGISRTKLAVALILSLLLIGGFYSKAAGRIYVGAAGTTEVIEGFCDREHKCSTDDECNSRCISQGYSRGICVKPIGSYCCCLRDRV
ncbi:hypothetical protein MKW98_021149 [Papaver atlanticum]|uniref:Uncharacterized protein n=1 Tax=Papaver atlanticum TaxID=357466 RepID=A0AAD4T747_9MAGN|nr:hypothetical protein MKW98_021149 [Papaver atlanticum]